MKNAPKKVKDQLKVYLDESEQSQSKVARSIGYSPAAVSQYLSGTYEGDIPGMERKIQGWLKREKARIDNLLIPTFKTTNFMNIQTVCSLVHEKRDMGIVVGPAGIGKTYAIEHYTRENPNVILLKVDAMYPRLTLVQKIAEAISLEIKGDFRMIFDHVLQVLEKRDDLLIIDEADYLNHQGLELLRNIHDKTGTGILMVGLNRLNGIITSNQNDHKQLESRLGFKLKLNTVKPEDCRGLIQAIDQVTVDKEVIEKMTGTAEGCVRILTKMFHRTYEMMKAGKETSINMDHLEKALIMMGAA